MSTPRVTVIICRLMGGPVELQNLQVNMKKYHPTIVAGDDWGKSHDYKDLKVLNAEGELLFIHQSPSQDAK